MPALCCQTGAQARELRGSARIPRRTPNPDTAMDNDYQDPPVNTRRGRASTWIALLLIALVLGFIIWFSVANWGPGDARHEAFAPPAAGVAA
jgi:ferric-dicitrate binding protein FerR (iron transport regulator)